jgi:hypothetical protein
LANYDPARQQTQLQNTHSFTGRIYHYYPRFSTSEGEISHPSNSIKIALSKPRPHKVLLKVS